MLTEIHFCLLVSGERWLLDFNNLCGWTFFIGAVYGLESVT